MDFSYPPPGHGGTRPRCCPVFGDESGIVEPVEIPFNNQEEYQLSAFGIWSMLRLRGLPEASRMAGGKR
jgi:hypothetical protein